MDDLARATAPDTAVDWRPFTAEPFEAADRDGRPLLLSLTATWCREYHEVDREVYADLDLAERIEPDFVPVRVDVDRRPRIRDRYNVGGFPSTGFLTPIGSAVAVVDDSRLEPAGTPEELVGRLDGRVT